MLVSGVHDVKSKSRITTAQQSTDTLDVYEHERIYTHKTAVRTTRTRNRKERASKRASSVARAKAGARPPFMTDAH